MLFKKPESKKGSTYGFEERMWICRQLSAIAVAESVYHTHLATRSRVLEVLEPVKNKVVSIEKIHITAKIAYMVM